MARYVFPHEADEAQGSKRAGEQRIKRAMYHALAPDDYWSQRNWAQEAAGGMGESKCVDGLSRLHERGEEIMGNTVHTLNKLQSLEQLYRQGFRSEVIDRAIDKGVIAPVSQLTSRWYSTPDLSF